MAGLSGITGLDARSLYKDQFNRLLTDLTQKLQKSILKSTGLTVGKVGKAIGKGYMSAGNFIANNNEAISAGFNLVPNPDTTLNTTELISGQVYDKASDMLMTNPYTALIGLGMKGAKKADLLSTATDFNDKDIGLNFFQHAGNFLTSLTPGSKLFSTKINPVDKSRLNGIASYTWYNDLDKYNNKGKAFYVTFGGKKMKEAANDYLLAVNTAINISDEGARAMKFDPYQVAKKSEQELRGGFDSRYGLLPTGKQGATLLFTKRTLSKSKIKKHQIGGKVTETSDFTDKVPEKLSLIPLDEYLQQKRLVWIDKAIQKASTRNAPYMFKNKDWKNCIATAFDSYGLYDKNGMPLVIRNADFAADPNRYGFTELPFGDDIDHLPDGVLIQDYNNPKDRTVPGHAIILTGRDENEVPIYSWSSGNNEIEDMHPLARLYSFYWTDKVKPRAYQFIGTPEQISQWINEYKQMYNLSDDDIKAFKEGGKVNVIPSGALHARKHNLTKIAEDGEKFKDVTTKGIPVVVEDEKGNLIQQAEVEREEIIFRLEVTKKLEELAKEHTDKAAIEAGKLLVKEILYNTVDNTQEMI